MNKLALFEEVADKLVKQLEKGTSPFQNPWRNQDQPYNAITGKAYKGLNSLNLTLQEFSDPRWVTFKQAQDQGWKIEKGAIATTINIVQTHYKKDVLENGKPVIDQFGNNVKISISLDRPIITSAKLFNGQQIIGIPNLQIGNHESEWKDIKRIESLTKNANIVIRHGGNEAFYNPIVDTITLPKKNQFEDKKQYYSVLLHEIAHWTGHPTRMNREINGKFGSEEYAREELRAEITSLLLAKDFKVGSYFNNSASYIASWIKLLKDKPFEIYKASSDAERIREYICNLELKRTIDQSTAKSKSLLMNDEIHYNNEKFKVVGLLPHKRLQLLNLETGQILRVVPSDGLYNQLLEAKEATNKMQSNPSLNDESEEINNKTKLRR